MVSTMFSASARVMSCHRGFVDSVLLRQVGGARPAEGDAWSGQTGSDVGGGGKHRRPGPIIIVDMREGGREGGGSRCR